MPKNHELSAFQLHWLTSYFVQIAKYHFQKCFLLTRDTPTNQLYQKIAFKTFFEILRVEMPISRLGYI